MIKKLVGCLAIAIMFAATSAFGATFSWNYQQVPGAEAIGFSVYSKERGAAVELPPVDLPGPNTRSYPLPDDIYQPGKIYDLWVTAYNVDQESAQSNIVEYAPTSPEPVGDTLPPEVAITNPKDGSMISGSVVAIQVAATDNIGVTTLELRVDGSLVKTVYNATVLKWNWNVKKAYRGTHTIAATAYDAAGNADEHWIAVYK